MEVLMRLWMELIVVKSGVDSIHAYTRSKTIITYRVEAIIAHSSFKRPVFVGPSIMC